MDRSMDHRRPPGRPAAAAAGTDAESGQEGLSGAEDRRKSLYALKILYERGLLPEAEYRRRVAALGGTP